MWREGLSASQIAAQLGGVSRNAVIGKVHRLGLSGRAPPSRPRPLVSAKPRVAAPRITAAVSAPKAAPAPKHLPADPATLLAMRPSATIHTLADHGCRWPIGEPEDAAFGYCGRRRGGHGPYCLDHTHVAFRNKGRGATKSAVDALVKRYGNH